MGYFLVEGGIPLRGRVAVGGSKNAALPVIFATLLTRGRSRLINLPDIEDVRVALELISEYGAVVSRSGNVTTVDTERLHFTVPRCEQTAKIRASTYLLGASLSRFGRFIAPSFGGCNFSPRPIDMHIQAARAYGATFDGDIMEAQSPHPFTVRFAKRSVGATVNALLLSAGVRGESRIYGGACEPHINTLVRFLVSAGADIKSAGGVLTVFGGELHGGEVTIPGDMIEAGTFLALSMLNDGRITVEGVAPSLLSGFLSPLILVGARLVINNGALSLRGRLKEKTRIVTAPYPGFPTDLQPIAAPLLASFAGGSITDTVWCGRYGYLSELEKMGLRYSPLGEGVEIFPSSLHADVTCAPDLRGGAACLIASLTADGESRVDNAEMLFRGYEHLPSKLTSLGARIKYIK